MSTAMKRIGAIALAAVMVLLLVWYVALYRPYSAKLSAAHRAKAAAEAQISQLGSKVAQLKALERQVSQDQSRLLVLSAAVPDLPDLSDVLGQLHNAATTSGVQLTTVGPAQPGTSTSASSGSGPGSISLSMGASGTYGQLVQFFNQLASMPRTVVLDSVNINSGGSGGLNASLTGRVFYAKSK